MSETPLIRLDSEGNFSLNIANCTDEQYENLRRVFPDTLLKRDRDKRLSWTSPAAGSMNRVEIVPGPKAFKSASIRIVNSHLTAPLDANGWYSLATAAFEAGMATEGLRPATVDDGKCGAPEALKRQCLHFLSAVGMD